MIIQLNENTKFASKFNDCINSKVIWITFLKRNIEFYHSSGTFIYNNNSATIINNLIKNL